MADTPLLTCVNCDCSAASIWQPCPHAVSTNVNCLQSNNNNIYLKSNIQCTERYEFSGLYNNKIQLQ